MYDMALWEFNACIRAYNRKREAEEKTAIANAWRTANWTGAAFGGKLKSLRHYLPDEDAVQAPKVSLERMAAIDKRFEERGHGDGAEKS